MGLDAVVYCNCDEKGRHITPPPPGIDIKVSPSGSINCVHETVDSAITLYAWTRTQDCNHADCIFLHHYLGNVGLEAFFRETLQQNARQFQTILNQVIYNGIHADDYLTLEQVEALRQELMHLPNVTCDYGEDLQYLDTFRDPMVELVNCSLKLRKPITFKKATHQTVQQEPRAGLFLNIAFGLWRPG